MIAATPTDFKVYALLIKYSARNKCLLNICRMKGVFNRRGIVVKFTRGGFLLYESLEVVRPSHCQQLDSGVKGR